MNTFLILINLANPNQAQEIADKYRTLPELAGWKGQICIEESCEEVDRTKGGLWEAKPFVSKLPEGTTPAVDVPAPDSTAPSPNPNATALDKVLTGVKGIFSKDIEANVEFEYNSTTSPDGTKSEHIKVKIGGSVKHPNP